MDSDKGFGLTTFLNERFSKTTDCRDVTLEELPAGQSQIDGIQFPPSNYNVFRIQNPSQFAAFILRKKEYEIRGVKYEIIKLLHGTPTVNAEGILFENFDHRRSVKHMLGPGVYFTKSYRKAVNCARRKFDEMIEEGECDYDYDDVSVFISEVIVGTKVTRLRWKNIQPISIDTGLSVDGRNFVKARDDEFLPIVIMQLEEF